MKKIIFFAAIVAAVTSDFGELKAQGPYLNVGVGYGLSIASQNFATNMSLTSVEVVKGSLGKGFHGGAGFGFMFTKNVGAELNLDFLLGGKIKISDNTNAPLPADESTLKATMLRINPCFKVSAGDEIRAYAKLGAVIGVAGNIVLNDVQYFGTVSNQTKVESTVKSKGGVAFGLSGAAGVEIMISDKFGIFVEANAIAQSYAPTKSKITSSTTNGVDNLSNMTTNQIEANYVSSYDPTTPPPGSTEPDRKLKYYYPFSSWGFSAGINLNFGHKRKH